MFVKAKVPEGYEDRNLPHGKADDDDARDMLVMDCVFYIY